jgi:hypothetical protein
MVSRSRIGHRAVVEGVEVEGDAQRRADLVLAPVALADRLGDVELEHELAAQRVGQLRAGSTSSGFFDRGSTATCREPAGVQLEHHPGLAAHLLLVVGVDEEGERGAGRAGRRLDHVGEEALVGVLVEVAEVLARVLGVLAEVEVGAVGDPLQLVPIPGEGVLDVHGAGRVVGQLVLVVGPDPQVGRGHPQIGVPVAALLLPVLEPPVGSPRVDRRTPSPSARTRGSGRRTGRG